MIRRHPQWVQKKKKKINTKSTFLSGFKLALGLEYFSLSRDSWVCLLQGQIGSEHLGFLLQTSKVKLSLAALVITLSLSVSGFGRDETLHRSWMGIISTHSHSLQQRLDYYTFHSNVMRCDALDLALVVFALVRQDSRTRSWFWNGEIDCQEMNEWCSRHPHRLPFYLPDPVELIRGQKWQSVIIVGDSRGLLWLKRCR